MKTSTPLPKWILHELENPSSPGGRHSQIVRLSAGLVRHGVPRADIFGMLRGNYSPDVTDEEIENCVFWAEERCPRGTSKGRRLCPSFYQRRERTKSRHADFSEGGLSRLRFLRGNFTEADLWEASPVRLSDNWREDFPMLLECLFFPGERINIVSEFAERNGKASPIGRGRTFSREEWIFHHRTIGVPEDRAGAWIRMNPTDGNGISDGNITAYRFFLLESDRLDLEGQVRLFAQLPLPFNAIISSGGKSLHGWVRTDAETVESYREAVHTIFSRLAEYGIDTANKNPSRLARLPGVQRNIGRIGDGRQRLLYLAPSRTASEAII
jgi:hypothetical protein